MDKIKRFFECYIPVTQCNLKCKYCYIIQENRRSNEYPKFLYSPEHIGNGLIQKRLGGICYFSICGGGETLLPVEVLDIVYNILKQGHYVNITTNGTLTKQFHRLIQFPRNFLQRLHFSFSLHYLELLRTNRIKAFFENIKLVKSLGSSYFTQLNLYDEYIPHLDEIKKLCLKEIGEIPQMVATRLECNRWNFNLYTDLSWTEYAAIGKSWSSPLFDFTMHNFMQKRREFCYAGDWSGILDLSNGILKKCYSSSIDTDIFKKIYTPIHFEAVGNNCKSLYCVNSSHFMSLGVIPDIPNLPSYAELRNRGGYADSMRIFLDEKLNKMNAEYNFIRKSWTNLKYPIINLCFLIWHRLKRLIEGKGVAL
jgi:pyruvate-formate lyase-activating enzyme